MMSNPYVTSVMAGEVPHQMTNIIVRDSPAVNRLSLTRDLQGWASKRSVKSRPVWEIVIEIPKGSWSVWPYDPAHNLFG